MDARCLINGARRQSTRGHGTPRNVNAVPLSRALAETTASFTLCCDCHVQRNHGCDNALLMASASLSPARASRRSAVSACARK